MLDRQVVIKVKAFEADNEINTVKPRVKQWIEERHIKLEPSPPHTQALNGGAERSGGVVKEKINAMRDSSKLPASLWREVSRAAIYLLNRTPRKRIKWKTTFEVFHSKPDERRKPDLTNLRAYGCKSYAMTATAMLKQERLKRFNPKAWIGYLVGYASSNTYRIWNPVTNEVIHTRAVIFNEQETFSGALEELRDDIREIDRDELARLLSEFALPEAEEEQVDRARPTEGVDDALWNQEAGNQEAGALRAVGTTSRSPVGSQVVEPASRSSAYTSQADGGASRSSAYMSQAPGSSRYAPSAAEARFQGSATGALRLHKGRHHLLLLR